MYIVNIYTKPACPAGYTASGDILPRIRWDASGAAGVLGRQDTHGQSRKRALRGGEQLPSIRSLANELSISAITTKRAYADLEAAGFIESVQGKGSFVAGVNVELLREEQLRKIENLLQQAVDEARRAGVGPDELREMFMLMLATERER